MFPARGVGDAVKLKTLMFNGALAIMAPDHLQSFPSIYHPPFIYSDHDVDFGSSRSHSANDHREPTPLEAFSRTIRNYVPSSIPIPSAAPSPPRVSRPVSFGSFLTTTQATSASVPPTARERDNDRKRRGSDASSAAAADSRGRWTGSGQRKSEPGGEMPVFSLDDDIPEDDPPEDGKLVTRYPGVGDTEEVLWAGWDVLADVADGNAEQAKTRYVPFHRLRLSPPTFSAAPRAKTQCSLILYCCAEPEEYPWLADGGRKS